MDGGVDFTFFPTLLTPFHLITWGWTGVGLCDYVRPGQSTRPVSIIICTELALLWYILVYKNTRSACTTQKPHPCRKQQNAGLWATVPFQFLSYLSLQQKWRDRTWRASWLCIESWTRKEDRTDSGLRRHRTQDFVQRLQSQTELFSKGGSARYLFLGMSVHSEAHGKAALSVWTCTAFNAFVSRGHVLLSGPVWCGSSLGRMGWDRAG